MNTEVRPIPLEALKLTWTTLMEMAENYELGTEPGMTLIEARRLVEVEVRAQFGDTAWEAMVEGS